MPSVVRWFDADERPSPWLGDDHHFVRLSQSSRHGSEAVGGNRIIALSERRCHGGIALSSPRIGSSGIVGACQGSSGILSAHQGSSELIEAHQSPSKLVLAGRGSFNLEARYSLIGFSKSGHFQMVGEVVQPTNNQTHSMCGRFSAPKRTNLPSRLGRYPGTLPLLTSKKSKEAFR